MKLQTKKFLNLLKADTFWLTTHNRSSSSTVALNAHMVKMSHRLLSDKINFPSRSVHCVQGSPFTLVPERWMQGLKKGKTAICSPLTMIVNVSPNIHQALFTYIHYSGMGYEAKLG